MDVGTLVVVVFMIFFTILCGCLFMTYIMVMTTVLDDTVKQREKEAYMEGLDEGYTAGFGKGVSYQKELMLDPELDEVYD